MEFKFHIVNLKKKFPLQISRGIHDKSQNLFIEFIKDGITAWGECAPGKTEGANSAQEVEKHLKRLIDSNIENLTKKQIVLSNHNLYTIKQKIVRKVYLQILE